MYEFLLPVSPFNGILMTRMGKSETKGMFYAGNQVCCPLQTVCLCLCYCMEVSWLPSHSFRGALGAFEAYCVT